MKITKNFIEAAKRAVRISIKLEKTSDRGTFERIFFYDKEDYMKELCDMVFRTDISGKYNTAYFSTRTKDHCGVPIGNFSLLMKIVKEGDELKFDAFTNNNQYLDRAEIPENNDANDVYGIHPKYEKLYNDVLMASVYRNDKPIIAEVVIEERAVPNNTARALQIK